jgi:hypothetical protein
MHFSSGIFILALLVLCCLTNVIGYLISILFLKPYKIGDKYPKISKVLVYFEKTTLFWIFMEAIIVYVCLFIILIFYLDIIGKPLL